MTGAFDRVRSIVVSTFYAVRPRRRLASILDAAYRNEVRALRDARRGAIEAHAVEDMLAAALASSGADEDAERRRRHDEIREQRRELEALAERVRGGVDRVRAARISLRDLDPSAADAHVREALARSQTDLADVATSVARKRRIEDAAQAVGS
ncbi:MAG: hypothetical protein PVSMB8_04810 [Vulcanimicrobiaceae bacterium]